MEILLKKTRRESKINHNHRRPSYQKRGGLKSKGIKTNEN